MPRTVQLVILAMGICGVVQPIHAQLTTEGAIQSGPDAAPTGYQSFRADFGVGPPESGDMDNTGDMYLQNDLEVAGSIYLQSSLDIQGLVRGAANIFTIESADRTGGVNEPEFWFQAKSIIRYLSDPENDSTTGPPFTWYSDGTTATDRIGELDGVGNLAIDGTLTENAGLDLAEAFFAGEPLVPGEVVRIAPGDPRTVLRSDGSGAARTIGVVSTRPGIVLGGGAFSEERLREVWGDRVADLFVARRASLEAEVLARPNGLAAKLELLRSTTAAAAPTDGGPEESAGYLRIAGELLAGDLEAAALELFFERNFVSVALAGRVPVRIDPDAGPIVAGDLLAPSATPGLATRATKPGPTIGVALEDVAPGAEMVTTFVQRSWYGGDAVAKATLSLGADGGLMVGGALTQASSRSLKRSVEAIDPAEVLARVAELPVAVWSYVDDPSNARHVGPMAEDFHRAFGVGGDPRHVALADLSGIALAAIQGLAEQVEARDARIADLEARLAALEERAR